MLVIPAIDILGGRCVRLTQGDYSHPIVYADDPAEVAQRYVTAGAHHIHVVDLDAARGSASNMPVIARILELPGIELQVAGGVRSVEAVAPLTQAEILRRRRELSILNWPSSSCRIAIAKLPAWLA